MFTDSLSAYASPPTSYSHLDFGVSSDSSSDSGKHSPSDSSSEVITRITSSIFIFRVAVVILTIRLLTQVHRRLSTNPINIPRLHLVIPRPPLILPLYRPSRPSPRSSSMLFNLQLLLHNHCSYRQIRTDLYTLLMRDNR